jgi:hypothetical protein
MSSDVNSWITNDSPWEYLRDSQLKSGREAIRHVPHISCVNIRALEDHPGHHSQGHHEDSRIYYRYTYLQTPQRERFLGSLASSATCPTPNPISSLTYRFVIPIGIPHKHESTTSNPTMLHAFSYQKNLHKHRHLLTDNSHTKSRPNHRISCISL